MTTTYEPEVPTLNEFEEKRRSDNEDFRQVQRDQVAAAKAAFNSENFVELSSGNYAKDAVTSVRFLDTTIHVRFNTGDIVAVTPEQLAQLTSRG